MHNPFRTYLHRSDDPDVRTIAGEVQEIARECINSWHALGCHDCFSDIVPCLSDKEWNQYWKLMSRYYPPGCSEYDFQRALFVTYLKIRDTKPITEGPAEVSHEEAVLLTVKYIVITGSEYVQKHIHLIFSPKEAKTVALLTRKILLNMIEQASAPDKDILEQARSIS